MKEYAGKFTDGTWERWPNAYMTLDEKDDISTTETDLQDYSKNQLAKWISGESDVNADTSALNSASCNKTVFLFKQQHTTSLHVKSSFKGIKR